MYKGAVVVEVVVVAETVEATETAVVVDAVEAV